MTTPTRKKTQSESNNRFHQFNTFYNHRLLRFSDERFAPLFALMIQVVQSLLQFFPFSGQKFLVCVRRNVDRRCHKDACARKLNQELQAVMEATGSNLAPYAPLVVAAMRGDPAK